MQFEYNLRLLTDKSWKNPRLHFHDNYEVLFSLTDTGSVFIENELFPLRSGTLCLIQYGVLHRVLGKKENFKRYVLHFPEEIILSLSNAPEDLNQLLHGRYSSSVLQHSEYAQIKDLFNRFNQLISENGINNLLCNITFLEILYRIISLLEDYPQQGDAITSPNYLRVKPVLRYIQDHLEDNLSLDFISNEFLLSKHYLCHLFKSATGFTINEYIIRSRIVHAQTLLRNGFTVQEAGESSGFRNNSHFIKTFGKEVGMSPGKYAKKYRKCNKL